MRRGPPPGEFETGGGGWQRPGGCSRSERWKPCGRLCQVFGTASLAAAASKSSIEQRASQRPYACSSELNPAAHGALARSLLQLSDHSLRRARRLGAPARAAPWRYSRGRHTTHTTHSRVPWYSVPRGNPEDTRPGRFDGTGAGRARGSRSFVARARGARHSLTLRSLSLSGSRLRAARRGCAPACAGDCADFESEHWWSSSL